MHSEHGVDFPIYKPQQWVYYLPTFLFKAFLKKFRRNIAQRKSQIPIGICVKEEGLQTLKKHPTLTVTFNFVTFSTSVTIVPIF